MANTTFSGPVRSEAGFQHVTKNATTGAFTTNHLNVKFDFVGMTHAAVSAGSGVALPADQVSTVNFTGAAACSMNLPAATVGTRVAYVQRVDTTGGTNTLTINADGNSNSQLTLTDFGLFEINILAKDTTNYYIWGYQEGADVPAFADQ